MKERLDAGSSMGKKEHALFCLDDCDLVLLINWTPKWYFQPYVSISIKFLAIFRQSVCSYMQKILQGGKVGKWK